MQTPSVAINGRFLAAAPSGVQRVAYELIRACDELLCAHEPTGRERPLWTLLRPKDAERRLPLRNIRTQTVGVATWQVWEQLELPWAARRSLLLSLANTAPVLHPANIVMIHDAQVFTTPQSYGRGLRNWYRLLLPALGRNARAVLTVSEYSKTQLVEAGVAKPERITVIPNGVDHFADVAVDSSAAHRLRGAPFVLALANAQAHKNVDLLLRAFADPRLQGFDLVLVGRAEASAFPTRPGTNVVFAGGVSDEQLKGLMQAALCLAFPSLTEGFGLPPLEAMSVGCPSIVAPCGALPETCGEAALYASPDDVDAWVSTICDLAADPAQRRRQIEAGQRQAQRFTWRSSARTLLTLMEGL